MTKSKLIEKVKKELETSLKYDFKSQFWDEEAKVILREIVLTSYKVFGLEGIDNPAEFVENAKSEWARGYQAATKQDVNIQLVEQLQAENERLKKEIAEWELFSKAANQSIEERNDVIEMLKEKLSMPCSRPECVERHKQLAELSPSPMEKDEEFEKITGFKTKAEFEAYEKGREHEQAVAIKFIEKWDGSQNSVLGKLLHSKLNTTSPMEGKMYSRNDIIKAIRFGEMKDQVRPLFIKEGVEPSKQVEVFIASLDKKNKRLSVQKLSEQVDNALDKKARKHNSPKLQEILDEVTPLEMEQKKAEMEGKTLLKGWVNVYEDIDGYRYVGGLYIHKEDCDANISETECNKRIACIDLSVHYEGEGLLKT